MEPWIRVSVVQQVLTSLRRSAANLHTTDGSCCAVGVATTLRTGRSGDRMPVEARNLSVLQNVQTDSVTDATYCSIGLFFFLGKGGRSMKYNARLYLVPRLTMSGATSLLHLYAQMALEMGDLTFIFYL